MKKWFRELAVSYLSEADSEESAQETLEKVYEAYERPLASLLRSARIRLQFDLITIATIVAAVAAVIELFQ